MSVIGNLPPLLFLTFHEMYGISYSLLGTVVSCAASGLCEVLISPVIAGIPAENPDHEMSKLHSVYAWGVVGMVVVATAFLLLVGSEHWQWLTLLMTLVPITAVILFAGAPSRPCRPPKRPRVR